MQQAVEGSESEGEGAAIGFVVFRETEIGDRKVGPEKSVYEARAEWEDLRERGE